MTREKRLAEELGALKAENRHLHGMIKQNLLENANSIEEELESGARP